MPALPKDMVWTVVKTGMSARAEVKTPPRFKTGDRVVARNVNPARDALYIDLWDSYIEQAK